MKRQLAALDIYTMVSEMQELQGCFVDKIYQLSRDELLLRLRNPATKKKEQIYIKNGQLVCLTDKQLSTPIKPTTFAMTLRKYLSNARLTKVTQQQFDRIIKIEFAKNQTFTLVIELFSNGNIILVNEENKIILPFIREEWAHRTIKSREDYNPPPSQKNPFDITKDDFVSILRESKSDIVRTLAISVNLSGIYAEEACARAKINKNSKPAELTENDISVLYTEMQRMLDQIKNDKTSPVLATLKEDPFTILPFEFQSYNDATYEPVEQMVRGFDRFIIQTVYIRQESKNQKQMDKLHRQLDQQQQAISDLDNKMIKQKQHAEILYLHFQQIDQLLKEIQQRINEKNKTNLNNYLSEHPLVETYDLSSQTIQVRLQDLEGNIEIIPLDIRKSIAENAEQAYNNSKKSKQKKEGAKKAITHTKKTIEEVQSHIEKEQERQENQKEKQRIFWFEKYRWFISSTGNLIIGGRDAKTNDQIVKKHLESKDRYAHADLHGAPSCIIKQTTYDNKPTEITEQTITEGCQFAAVYSKAWKQYAEAQSYWVLPEQVSKTPQSGEFVPRGAFIIRGQRSYCKSKMELAIGSIRIEDTEKIIGGPVKAIKKWCEKYVILQPDTDKKQQIAKKLASMFDVSVEQINKVLPPGESMIVSIVGENQSES
jgi:predicted ribosome quality control (RQC) complex YloA/Tae2 family protein